nr:integrase, catalytic region, zinc finger, CCHC-type, peptidase aspartic, catalytic [Tanacetum cinerariifolium]
QNGLVVVLGIANQSGTGNVVAARAEGDLDEIEEVNGNCILMENLDQASTSGTQHDRAPVYDTNGSTENDNHVTSVAPNMVHSGGTVETSPALNEEIRAHQETVYHNLVDQVTQNNWYTKFDECKYDKISYDKAYNDMQQKVKRLQAQLRDLKGKSCNTPSASNTLDPLNQKLESKIVELEFQVAHAKLHDLIFENAKLKAWLFENTSKSMKNTSGTSVTPHVEKPKLSAVTPHSKKLHASTHSHSVVQICQWCVDLGCSKHMTGNIKLLINFVWKFLGTVRFGNEHIADILGYVDLKWGNIIITRVYFVEGLGHNLFPVGQFCDADLEVTFRRNT